MSRVSILAAVALLGLAACGDGGSAVTDSAQASDNTVGDTSIDDTAVDDTFVDDTSVDVSFADDPVDPNAPGVGSDFCAVYDELSQSDYDPFTATPAENEAYFSIAFPDMLGRLQDSTPDELKADVATVGTAFGALISEMESNGWDFSAAYADPAVQTLMTAPEIDTAGANIDAYCGV